MNLKLALLAQDGAVPHEEQVDELQVLRQVWVWQVQGREGPEHTLEEQLTNESL
jgi:hypothetical protein